MTRDDYSTYVHKVKYIVGKKTNDWYNLSTLGKERLDYKELLKVLNLYIITIENFNPPMIIRGTISKDSTSLIPDANITTSLYAPYLNHLITGDGIGSDTRAIKFATGEITLSEPATADGTGVFIIADNCLTISNMLCINGHINKLLGTSFCVDFYVSEFDINTAELDYTDTYLLTGYSSTILIGTNIYDSLDKTTTWDGEDTTVLYSFYLKYPYFAYPATYDDLAHIYDQEGDDVLASGSFRKHLMDVTLPNGTVIPYKVYNTEYKTAILSQTYTFEF